MTNLIDSITGKPTTVTTQTTVTDTPKTNWGLIIGGIVLAVGSLLAAAWYFGAFKKKTPTA